MPDYHKGCIYKIKHQLDYNDENIYIGSTCNFIRRRCMHKSDCCNPDSKSYNLKLYQYIRENGGWKNFEVLILEECAIEKLIELEQSYMDFLKPTLNQCNAVKIN